MPVPVMDLAHGAYPRSRAAASRPVAPETSRTITGDTRRVAVTARPPEPVRSPEPGRAARRPRGA